MPTRPSRSSPDPARYVDSQQVADLAAVVFHGFVSLSIQHLVHEIGLRMLERYPELTEITFEAQNRTFDPAVQDETDERLKVLTDPRPPYRPHRADDASRVEPGDRPGAGLADPVDPPQSRGELPPAAASSRPTVSTSSTSASASASVLRGLM